MHRSVGPAELGVEGAELVWGRDTAQPRFFIKLNAFGVGALAFVAGNAGGITRDLLI